METKVLDKESMNQVAEMLERLDNRLTELEGKGSMTSTSESSASEAVLQDMQDELTRRGDELARLMDIYQRLGHQVSTTEGFAELAEAAHLFQGSETDVDFVNFAHAIGKGHLVRYLTEDETETSLNELEAVEADEIVELQTAVARALEGQEGSEETNEENPQEEE